MDFEHFERMRRERERTSEQIRALQVIAKSNGERIQTLLRISEQRLKCLEEGRKTQ